MYSVQTSLADQNMNYCVIVPSYNRPAMLRRALKSIASQTVAPSTVHLIIDEVEHREKYQFLSEFDLNLDIVFTTGAIGGARARNLGLDRATSNYVFFLDDDDEWLPNKIEKQIRLLESRPDCVGVTCWSEKIFEASEQRRVYRPLESELNNWMALRNLTGSFSFFGFKRNQKTQDIRIFKELPMSQDMEFYIALSKFGRICVADEILARYHVHLGERISGSYSKEIKAIDLIINHHRDCISFGDRLWLLGSRFLLSGRDANGKLSWFANFFAGAVIMLLSFRNLKNSLGRIQVWLLD